MIIQKCCLCNAVVKTGNYIFPVNKNLDILICKKCYTILTMLEQWKLEYPEEVQENE